jgi:formylglycine-generating enzyme
MGPARISRRLVAFLGLAGASVSAPVGCGRSALLESGASGESGTSDGATSSSSSSSGGSGSGISSGSSSGSTSDASSGSANDASSGSAGGDDDGSAAIPPNCQPGGDGLTNCGAASESCCTSPQVTGGTYFRTYANSGSGPTGEADPASVSTFRLDKYDVTVGRFRQFVRAWNGGAGWLPAAGSGKHTHLNDGRGLANSAAAGTYETGWVASDDSSVAPTDPNLMACYSVDATWTPTAGTQENLPINCVTWQEAYAFCIWDGGFLPSEAEWEYAAAGGSQQREYPWGSTAPGTSSQYAIYGCYYPTGSSISGCMDVVSIAPVGTATLGAGLWGHLDMAGEMFQWTMDWYEAYVDPCTDCAYLDAASVWVIRGGVFDDDVASTLLPSFRSDSYSPGTRLNFVGFRCARVP